MNRRAPGLILVCGLMTTGVGVAMLLVANRVEGLIWLAVPITVLGLALVAFWLKERLRAPVDGAAEPAAPERLPGKWYPFAVVGVGAVLAAWFVYWTKFR